MAQVAERLWQKIVSSKEELRAIVGEALERSVKKEMPRLDDHCRAIIAKAPFALIGTSDAAGRCDVSPKGDLPGFALVLDEKTVAIPDRPGNRRTDSLKNILENPHVGILFIVPGKDETLRVNGRATIVQDEALLDRMAVDGKPPKLAIIVEVEECYAHCAKAFKRSGLWEPERWPDSSDLPTMAQMMYDQAKTGQSLEELQCLIAEGTKREKLY